VPVYEPPESRRRSATRASCPHPPRQSSTFVFCSPYSWSRVKAGARRRAIREIGAGCQSDFYVVTKAENKGRNTSPDPNSVHERNARRIGFSKWLRDWTRSRCAGCRSEACASRRSGSGVAFLSRCQHSDPCEPTPQRDPLTDAELDYLGDFLECCKGGKVMNFEELDGFFAALLGAPAIHPQSFYLRRTFRYLAATP